MGSTMGEHAGAVRELAARWLDAILVDDTVVAARGDVVFSPVGLWLALGAVASGAEGETRARLGELLGVAGPEAGPVVTAVARELVATQALAVATGVWSRDELRAAYRSGLPDVGFGKPVEQADPDAWVARATGGLIECLPVKVGAEDSLVLVNALALKARWVVEFDPDDTQEWWGFRPDPPGVPASTEATDRAWDASDIRFVDSVQMMCKHVPAHDVWTIPGPDGEITVVELPCAGDDGALVRFALGPEGAPPASTIAAAWVPRAAGTAFVGADVILHVPRFELRTFLDVTPHLTRLGLGVALTDDAEFGAMSDAALQIGQAVQESLLRIGEKGVEAASVTAVLMCEGVPPRDPNPPRRVIFDRSFACAVLDASGAVPLFAAYQATRPEHSG
ncbi:serpin family protein [Embleya scabrispora]|uniref:serpin family protein n=1 Tax=Embleya scabrispora TaxID=159449 RepID=UPI00039BEFE1|nr:serpin family protein [Embleya scabrispora]MYS83820.1 hypothetical protein [Streptomyces sp. SID5474]